MAPDIEPVKHPFGYVHPCWNGRLPHPFELCCVAEFGRRVCRCGLSERNRAAHPI